MLGEVGVHRPYFKQLSSGATAAQVRAARERQNQDIRAYTDEMDVAPALLETMMSVPPENIRILTVEEFQNFRLEGKDATEDEIQTAKNARVYGITSAEYRRRFAAAHERCWQKVVLNDYPDCQEANMLGISVAEARIRRARFSAVCKSNVESEVYDCFRRTIVLGH